MRLQLYILFLVKNSFKNIVFPPVWKNLRILFYLSDDDTQRVM